MAENRVKTFRSKAMPRCNECAYFTDLGGCRGPVKRSEVSFFQKACEHFEPHEQKPTEIERPMAKEKQEQTIVEEAMNKITRTCKRCGRVFPIEDFVRNKYGYTYVCKECKKKGTGPRSYRVGEKPLAVSISAFSDEELFDELRSRGWSGRLTKSIDYEL